MIQLPATYVRVKLLSISVTHSVSRQVVQREQLTTDPLSGPVTDEDEDIDRTNRSQGKISQDAKNTGHLIPNGTYNPLSLKVQF